jgi:hypothetical protein
MKKFGHMQGIYRNTKKSQRTNIGTKRKGDFYVESWDISHRHAEKKHWQRCDSPAIPLKFSAFIDIDLSTVCPLETGNFNQVKNGLIDFEKQCKIFWMTSVVGQFALRFRGKIRCRCIKWPDIKSPKIRSIAFSSRCIMIILDKLFIHQLKSH